MSALARAVTATAYGTVSWLEVTWILFVGFCLVVTADVLRSAWCDMPKEGEPGVDAVDEWITGGTVRTEAINVFGQVVFLVMGVLAALTPPAPDLAYEETRALSAVALPTLIMVYQASRTWDALLRRRGRRRIRAALRAERAERARPVVVAGVPVVKGGRRAYDPPAQGRP